MNRTYHDVAETLSAYPSLRPRTEVYSMRAPFPTAIYASKGLYGPCDWLSGSIPLCPLHKLRASMRWTSVLCIRKVKNLY